MASAVADPIRAKVTRGTLHTFPGAETPAGSAPSNSRCRGRSLCRPCCPHLPLPPGRSSPWRTRTRTSPPPGEPDGEDRVSAADASGTDPLPLDGRVTRTRPPLGACLHRRDASGASRYVNSRAMPAHHAGRRFSGGSPESPPCGTLPSSTLSSAHRPAPPRSRRPPRLPGVVRRPLRGAPPS